MNSSLRPSSTSPLTHSSDKLLPVFTLESVPGFQVKRVLGLVRGNTIRARHLGKDVLALFRNLVGGEIAEYTKVMAESREQALDRMRKEAHDLGANAVICMRITTSTVMQGAAEILCYGTAVCLEAED
ncbi:MAG: YbjQ family protein [Deltaproteobacteria bacterium]|nr:YbjQ family protein [Deltaproteobacteria bacterium]